MNRQIRVEADLTIEVDGTPARLSSEGERLVLSSPHPERVWQAVLSSALPAGVGSLDGPRAIGRLAGELAASGVRLEVTGPRGSVAHLGQGVDSRLGRLATGSSAVAPGAPAAVAVLLWSRVSRRAGAAAAAVVVLAVAVGLGRKRR